MGTCRHLSAFRARKSVPWSGWVRDDIWLPESGTIATFEVQHSKTRNSRYFWDFKKLRSCQSVALSSLFSFLGSKISSRERPVSDLFVGVWLWITKKRVAPFEVLGLPIVQPSSLLGVQTTEPCKSVKLSSLFGFLGSKIGSVEQVVSGDVYCHMTLGYHEVEMLQLLKLCFQNM